MILDAETVKIYLQDIDGITISGTNYKIAKGAKILIPIKQYPAISLSSNLGVDTDTSSPVTTTRNFTNILGNVSYTGFARPTITLEALLPIDENVLSQADYFGVGSSLTSNQVVAGNFYLLFNMWIANHTYYLTDVDKEVSKPNLGLPLNILMKRTDIYNNTIFSSSGVPVIIRNISTSGRILNLKTGDDNKENSYVDCKIDLVIDTYGA